MVNFRPVFNTIVENPSLLESFNRAKWFPLNAAKSVALRRRPASNAPGWRAFFGSLVAFLVAVSSGLFIARRNT